MKDFITKSALFLVYIFGGSYLGLLALVILQYPVKMIFEDANMSLFFALCIDTVLIASTALYSYRVGYKDNTRYEAISVPKTAAMIGCACAAFVLLALLFSFGHPHTLNTVYFAYAILGPEKSWNLDIVTIAEQYGGLLLALTTLQTFLCGGGMFTGYLLGGRKRRADRKKLTGRD